MVENVITYQMKAQATLKKKSVSCRPGGTNKNHPGGREILFFPKYFFSSVI